MNGEEVSLAVAPYCERDEIIEFNGAISERARLDRVKRINRIIILPLAILLAVAFVSTVLCLAFAFYEPLYAVIPLLVLSVLLIVLTYYPNNKMRLFYADYLTFPSTIIIFNGVISYSNPYFKKQLIMPLAKVRKIVDAGEWYYIVFRLGDIGNSWICQKSLLTNGTIEDFEKLFEGKIVCK